MKDEQCVRFLQWALPELHMRWPGFRKVRKQVCKRIDRRIRVLGLAGVEAYQDRLETHAGEWQHLDPLCRITISRFYRDKGVFAVLARQVLPSLVRTARGRGDATLRIWCAGCGSGEEAYTLGILWATQLKPRFPGMRPEIVATDADSDMIRRARIARYEFSSLKDLPARWRELAFTRDGENYSLRPAFRHDIHIVEQDIREARPEGRFDLVLCRNLVFTYFDDALQRRLLRRIVGIMRSGAALVLGIHEQLPEGVRELSTWCDPERVFCKVV